MAWEKIKPSLADRAWEIRQIRRLAGLTQAQFAEKLGVTANTLARQERGEHGIPEPVMRLARIVKQCSDTAEFLARQPGFGRFADWETRRQAKTQKVS